MHIPCSLPLSVVPVQGLFVSDFISPQSLSFTSIIPAVARLIFPKLSFDYDIPCSKLQIPYYSIKTLQDLIQLLFQSFFLFFLQKLFSKVVHMLQTWLSFNHLYLLTIVLPCIEIFFLKTYPKSVPPSLTFLLFLLTVLVFPQLDMVFAFSEIPCLMLIEHSWL